jgi:hypothetical protein
MRQIQCSSALAQIAFCWCPLLREDWSETGNKSATVAMAHKLEQVPADSLGRIIRHNFSLRLFQQFSSKLVQNSSIPSLDWYGYSSPGFTSPITLSYKPGLYRVVQVLWRLLRLCFFLRLLSDFSVVRTGISISFRQTFKTLLIIERV